MIEDTQLKYALVKEADLNKADIRRMFQLMQSHYTHVTEAMFLKDLSKKHFVGVIKDNENEVQGFTTFAINPQQCAGKDFHIIFSGDTIIDKNYWGSQIMMKGWCQSVGAMIATDTSKPWYWYLLSKGHRTYMYLPLFFHEYYPSATSTTDQKKLFHIADKVSRVLFNNDWKPEKGIIQFSEHHGALHPELSAGTYKKEKNAHVRLFLEMNPEFHKGDELVCIAPIMPENMKRSAKDNLLEGMQHNIDLNSLEV